MPVNLDTKLSPHFTLRELVTTSHRSIDNTPTPEIIVRLTKLCRTYLEPVRNQFGPVYVTSGYRCLELNRKVGSGDYSAHPKGCAADFVILGTPCIEVVDWIVDHSGLVFDQVIDEYSQTSNWVHLGMAWPGQSPRKQALTMRNRVYKPFDRSVIY